MFLSKSQANCSEFITRYIIEVNTSEINTSKRTTTKSTTKFCENKIIMENTIDTLVMYLSSEDSKTANSNTNFIIDLPSQLILDGN